VEDAGNLLNQTLAAPPECGRERSADNFVWGLLKVQDSLEGPLYDRVGPSCRYRTPIMVNEILEARGTPKH